MSEDSCLLGSSPHYTGGLLYYEQSLDFPQD
jgi:hypothetical protein